MIPPGVMEQQTEDPMPNNLLPIPPEEDLLIRAADVPKYIGLAHQTLSRRRHEGLPPRFVRLGGRVYYLATDLRSWVHSQVRENTIKKNDR